MIASGPKIFRASSGSFAPKLLHALHYDEFHSLSEQHYCLKRNGLYLLHLVNTLDHTPDSFDEQPCGVGCIECTQWSFCNALFNMVTASAITLGSLLVIID